MSNTTNLNPDFIKDTVIPSRITEWRSGLDITDDAIFFATKNTAAGGVYLDGVSGRIILPATTNAIEAFRQKGRALTYTWRCNAKQETFKQPIYISDKNSSYFAGDGINIFFFDNTKNLVVTLWQPDIGAVDHYTIYWMNVIDGKMHDFAVVIDYTGSDPIITAYRDGVSLGPGIVNVPKTGIFDDTNAIYRRFGSDDINFNQYLKGTLSNCLIYNRALSANEIKKLHKTGNISLNDKWGGPLIPSDYESSGVGLIENVATTSFIAFKNTTTTYGSVWQSFHFEQPILPGDSIQVIPVPVPGLSNTPLAYTEDTWLDISLIADTYDSILDTIRYNLKTNTFENTNTLTNLSNSSDLLFRIEFTCTSPVLNQEIYLGVQFQKLGCILDLDFSEGLGRQFFDKSSNRYHGLASELGVTSLIPSLDGQVFATQTISNNFRLNGGTIFPGVSGYKIKEYQVHNPLSDENIILTKISSNAAGNGRYFNGSLTVGPQTTLSVPLTAFINDSRDVYVTSIFPNNNVLPLIVNNGIFVHNSQVYNLNGVYIWDSTINEPGINGAYILPIDLESNYIIYWYFDSANSDLYARLFFAEYNTQNSNIEIIAHTTTDYTTFNRPNDIINANTWKAGTPVNPGNAISPSITLETARLIHFFTYERL